MYKCLYTALGALTLSACSTSPAKPENPLTAYTCNGTINSLNADYYTMKNPRVLLPINGKTETLYRVASSFGMRFSNGSQTSSEAIQTPDKPGTLIWWNKGSDAILYTIAERPDGFRYEKQLATCTSTPQPLAAPSLTPLPTSVDLPGTIPGTAPKYTTQAVTI